MLTRLGPQLLAAESDRLISSWFFIRKRPCWRIRYLPAAGRQRQAQARIGHHLDQVVVNRFASAWTNAVYEPEVCAFGGGEAMTVAHHLFHQDSRCVLDYLAREAGYGHRREMTVMLCALLMRAARQDWYEQGDVWARVALHRRMQASCQNVDHGSFRASIRRLLTVDGQGQMHAGAPLAYAADWAAAFATAGRQLGDLAEAGVLRRGLRDVLAHHVIFTWNRLGLPYSTQAVLATTARTVVFGPDPTSQQVREGEQ